MYPGRVPVPVSHHVMVPETKQEFSGGCEMVTSFYPMELGVFIYSGKRRLYQVSRYLDQQGNPVIFKVKVPAVHLKFLTTFLDSWNGSCCGNSSSEEKQRASTVITANLDLVPPPSRLVEGLCVAPRLGRLRRAHPLRPELVRSAARRAGRRRRAAIYQKRRLTRFLFLCQSEIGLRYSISDWHVWVSKALSDITVFI